MLNELYKFRAWRVYPYWRPVTSIILMIGLLVAGTAYASGTVICTQVGTDTYCNYIGD